MSLSPNVTGGGTTSVCIASFPNRGPRNDTSRLGSRGAGATGVGSGRVNCARRSLIRAGADTGGGMTWARFAPGTRRLEMSRAGTEGAGGTTCTGRAGVVKRASSETCGAGGTTVLCGAETARVVRSPSAGGGPAKGRYARRLATSESARGSLISGASTTRSRNPGPRETRIRCVG